LSDFGKGNDLKEEKEKVIEEREKEGLDDIRNMMMQRKTYKECKNRQM
jgi:hypothetical protein